MAMAKEPRKPTCFTLQLNGAQDAGMYRECTIGSTEVPAVDYFSVDAGGKTTLRRISGTPKGGEIVLTRALDTNKVLSDWLEKCRLKGSDDTAARCDGIITALSDDLSPIASWSFLQGFPTKLEFQALKADDNNVAVEKITIAHEGVKRVT
jgi:phage tail-like protein